MYKKILLTSLFFLCTLGGVQGFAAGSCQIETGPIALLATYTRTVNTELIRLEGESQKAGSCGITRTGASASVERTFEIIDRALVEVPHSTNILLDFRYNIEVAANGETRSPVMRDVQIFAQMSDRISNTISSIANRCTLDGEIRSSLSTLLSANQTLENIYKKAVLGEPVIPTGLSPANTELANAINTSYIPPATAGCKDSNTMEELIAKSMKSLEKLGSKNQNIWADWRKAKLLLQGGKGSAQSTTEYVTTQRELLQAELARQGYTSRMAQTMLSNFDCFKSKTQGDLSAESSTFAERRCFANPILGVENILLPWRKKVTSATTTTDRSSNLEQLIREQKLKSAIVSTSNKLEIYRTPSIDIKSAIMSNLIDIHIGLISTSEQVEKRLQKMYDNCKKGKRIIPCPRP